MMTCDIKLQMCRSSRPLLSSPIACHQVGHRHSMALRSIQCCSTSDVPRLAAQQSRSRCTAQPHQQHHLHLAPPLLLHSQSNFSQGRKAAAVLVTAAAHEQPVVDVAAGQASSSSRPQPSGSTSSSTKSRKQQAPSSSSSRGSSSSSSEDSSSGPDISIKVLSGPSELSAVAKLRAEAYYEVRQGPTSLTNLTDIVLRSVTMHLPCGTVWIISIV